MIEMKSSLIKLNAKIISSYYGKKSAFFSIEIYLLKLFFLLSGVFCTAALTVFIKSELYRIDLANDVMYISLFTAGIMFSICFYIITDYILKAEFLKTSIRKERFKLFEFLNISLQLKIIYLYSAKFIINFFKTVFYLLPAVLTALVTIALLENGIDKKVFAALCLLFIVLLVSGMYFSFCSCQRLAFLSQAIYLNQSESVFEIIKRARVLSDGKCFEIAHFKLSFLGWKMLCIFILPMIFVVPYYNRCIALYAKQTSCVKSPRSVSEKPVIFMKPTALAAYK